MNDQWSNVTRDLGNRAASAITVVSASDGIVRPVTDSMGMTTSPTWSTDADWIDHRSDRAGEMDVYGVRMKGSANGWPPRRRALHRPKQHMVAAGPCDWCSP